MPMSTFLQLVCTGPSEGLDAEGAARYLHESGVSSILNAIMVLFSPYIRSQLTGGVIGCGDEVMPELAMRAGIYYNFVDLNNPIQTAAALESMEARIAAGQPIGLTNLHFNNHFYAIGARQEEHISLSSDLFKDHYKSKTRCHMSHSGNPFNPHCEIILRAYTFSDF